MSLQYADVQAQLKVRPVGGALWLFSQRSIDFGRPDALLPAGHQRLPGEPGLFPSSLLSGCLTPQLGFDQGRLRWTCAHPAPLTLRARRAGQERRQGQADGPHTGRHTALPRCRTCTLLPRAEWRAPVQYACMFISAGEPGNVKKIQASVAAARKVFRVMRVRWRPPMPAAP